MNLILILTFANLVFAAPSTDPNLELQSDLLLTEGRLNINEEFVKSEKAIEQILIVLREMSDKKKFTEPDPAELKTIK